MLRPVRTLWNVIGLCFLAIIGIGAYQSLTGAANRAPDLTVTTLSATRASGENYTFSARIINQGNGRAAPSLARLSLDIDGNDAWDVFATAQRVGQLTPGNSADVQWSNDASDASGYVFSWNATSGTHRAKVEADVGEGSAKGAVKESNEKNNEKIIEFTVP